MLTLTIVHVYGILYIFFCITELQLLISLNYTIVKYLFIEFLLSHQSSG